MEPGGNSSSSPSRHLMKRASGSCVRFSFVSPPTARSPPVASRVATAGESSLSSSPARVSSSGRGDGVVGTTSEPPAPGEDISRGGGGSSCITTRFFFLVGVFPGDPFGAIFFVGVPFDLLPDFVVVDAFFPRARSFPVETETSASSATRLFFTTVAVSSTASSRTAFTTTTPLSAIIIARFLALYARLIAFFRSLAASRLAARAPSSPSASSRARDVFSPPSRASTRRPERSSVFSRVSTPAPSSSSAG